MLVYFINHSSAVDHLGGSERSLFRMIDEWREIDPKLEPYFITKAPRGLVVAELERRGWGFTALPYRGWAVPDHESHRDKLAYFAAEDYAATSEIVRIMERRRPDLVVTNTLVAPWGAFAAKTLGIPHAWMVREYGDLDHGLTFIQGRERTLSDIGLLSEAVLANSEAIRDHLAQYIPAEKLSIVYPALDVAEIQQRASEQPTLEPFPLADPGLRVTVVGRLAPSKGQWRVVEALGALKDRDVTASICFVGASMEPDYDRALLQRAAELGVADRIVFAGEHSNPFPFIKAADLCVTPSGQEAFGRTTLEYLTLGKPVIATDSGGSRELVIPGSNGALFDPETPSKLADHLQSYAADATLLQRHARGATERAAYVASPERGNAAAIERMRGLAGGPAYKLPDIARFWFDLPALSGAGRARSRVSTGYVARVLKIRATNFLRDPIGSSRRNIRAWKDRRG